MPEVRCRGTPATESYGISSTWFYFRAEDVFYVALFSPTDLKTHCENKINADSLRVQACVERSPPFSVNTRLRVLFDGSNVIVSCSLVYNISVP